MEDETDIYGQLENSLSELQKLASIVSGKIIEKVDDYNKLAPQLSTQAKIEKLDPYQDRVEIEALKIIDKRQQRLIYDIKKYTQEFENLRQRLFYRNNITLFEKTKNLIGNILPFFGSGVVATSVPSYNEILAFIDKIIRAAKLDYGIEFDSEAMFSDLVYEVKSLAQALGLSIKLKIIDEKLTKEPLKNLLKREKELNSLVRHYEIKCNIYFQDFNSLDHPFNKLLWQQTVNNISKDIKSAKEISELCRDLNLAINNYQVEADLPSIKTLSEIDSLIEIKFDVNNSPRTASVKLEFIKIKEIIQNIKEQKINQAIDEFTKFSEKFELWHKTINDIQEDFTINGGKSFPWRFLPPSQKEVQLLQEKIVQRKIFYKDWPCVKAVISNKSYQLDHYERLLVVMKDVTQDNLDNAFNDPSFSIKKIQHYIKIYKQLLIKGGYDNAEQQISDVQLKLFKFAHAKNKKAQWFSMFRRSYYDNLSVISWRDVAANSTGNNYGYSGTRTSEVLKTLGWFKESKLTGIAPEYLKGALQDLSYNDLFI